MEQGYITDKKFDTAAFADALLTKNEYEHCEFLNCDMGSADLSGNTFVDSVFNGCNLSLSKFAKTAFRDVQFKNCKMLGIRFDTCDDFILSFSFDNCQLDHSSFYKMKLKKINIINSRLTETDFTSADLTEAIFASCDLSGAVFENTILEKADLRSAYNYSIDPEANRIRKAKFSLHGLAGLLHRYDIQVED